MADKTRREILSEAFDAAEKDDDKPSGEVSDESGDAQHRQDPDTRASGESEPDLEGADKEKPGEGGGEIDAKTGKEDEKRPAEKETKKPIVKEPETADQKEARAAQEAAQRTREAARTTDKPPNSWKPGAREDWGKIPPAARAEISRRELEIQRELSQTATIRRFSTDLAAVVQPHLPIIQAQKTTPLAAIDTLMKTASSLYQGNQEQKSRIVAQIIQDYGVDVRILDKVLSQQPIPPQQNGGGANPNAVPPWAQPIFSFMTQAEAARQQRETDMQTEAAATVEAAKADMPFLDDLREDVADILEFAAKRGRVVTLEQAYERAVALDPEISKIANQRKIAATQRSGTNLDKARKAASTIHGSPRGGGTPAGSKGGKQSRRDVIAEAWDNAET